MQLVILAAGHGRRFGGLKQLAPVGPDGEAIMDYTARTAESCGFDSVVLVVRPEIEDEIARHTRRYWPESLETRFVHQSSVPGTAQAVLSAREAVDGPFAVANADDLYGEDALALLIEHFRPTLALDSLDPQSRARHLLVAYRLIRTVLTSARVTRGLCEVADDARLVEIAEHTVKLCGDGSFIATPLVFAADGQQALSAGTRHRLSGEELVSMNLWGFHERMFDHLENAIENFDPTSGPHPELLLPDVVGTLLDTGQDSVHVVETAARCIGITHREDTEIVGDELMVASPSRDVVHPA